MITGQAKEMLWFHDTPKPFCRPSADQAPMKPIFNHPD